jgi:hypothetical protein
MCGLPFCKKVFLLQQGSLPEMYSRIATQIRVGKEKIEIDRKSTFVTIMN